MRKLLGPLFAFTMLAFAAWPQDRVPAAAAPYRHGYYLFLTNLPVLCEACYIPLLLTTAPLEEIAKNPGGQDADLISTYERDSIFQFNGIVHVMPADITVGPRSIRLRNRVYRYQEITAAEILHLLEHPEGTIPVSRPILHSDLPPGPGLDQLIAGFHAVK
jgi:hypothetical protein